MSCAEGIGCQTPSWDDFKTSAFVCIGTWAGILCTGLIAASMRHLWSVELVSMWLQPVALLLKGNQYYISTMAGLSLMMCLFHVIYIEGAGVFSWGNMVETYTCYVHACEVLLLIVYNCALSQEDIVAFAKGRLFSDCMIIVSILIRGTMTKSYFSFSFFAAIRIRNLWMSYEDTLNPLDKGFKVKMFHEASALTSMIFVSACMLQQTESFEGTSGFGAKWQPWETATSASEVWTTTSSVYFVLCTLSTVGYGDFQPRSIMGQVALILVIVTGIGLTIYTVVGVMQILQQSKGGSSEYRIHSANRMRRHVVIAGNPCAQTLRDIIEELYHPDHEEIAKYLDTVILLPVGAQGVIDNIRAFLYMEKNRRLVGKVTMITGSPLDERDLEKAKLGHASLGYVLPNVHAADNEREDIENAMRALSMHRYAPYVRLVSLLMNEHYREMMISTGLQHKDIVCIDEMKLGILGKTCGAQCYVTLVCNLFKSSGEYDDSGEGEAWMGDYKRGMANEIYETRLAACYRGAPFGEVAIDILTRSDAKAYMIGVIDESRYPGTDPIIRMHPGRHYRLGTDEDFILKGIFIAPDPECIQQHPPEKPFSWHLGAGDKSSNTGEGALLPHLPGALPERHDTSNLLVKQAQRWVLNPAEVQREHDDYTLAMMDDAAKARTVQGLKNVSGAPRAEVAEMMNIKVRDDMWMARDIRTLEDDAEGCTDPKTLALKQQSLLAARGAELEKQKGTAEVRTKTEVKLRRMAERIVANADKAADMWEDPHDKMAKELDAELWGGPQTPRKPLYGNPTEPPTSLLVRGEHIIMIALEGNEDVVASGCGGEKIESSGRKLGLEYFMKALRAEVPAYAQRPVVVLSQRVPYDWPLVTSLYKDVYLITGRPLATENLYRSGLRHAKAVVIYQRGPVTSSDPTLVDAQSIFGACLAKSAFEKESKDIMCIVDLNLDGNSYFVTDEDEVEGFGNADDLTIKQSRALIERDRTPYIDTKRYCSGQMFASAQAIASLVANMLYNPALGALVREMLECRFVVVPIPAELPPKATFRNLYEHMMRRRNLVAIGLLRNFEAVVEEDEGEEEQEQEPKEQQLVMRVKKPVARWVPGEPPGNRFIYTMPEGDRRVAPDDGVVCVVPKGDALAFTD